MKVTENHVVAQYMGNTTPLIWEGFLFLSDPKNRHFLSRKSMTFIWTISQLFAHVRLFHGTREKCLHTDDVKIYSKNMKKLSDSSRCWVNIRKHNERWMRLKHDARSRSSEDFTEYLSHRTEIFCGHFENINIHNIYLFFFFGAFKNKITNNFEQIYCNKFSHAMRQRTMKYLKDSDWYPAPKLNYLWGWELINLNFFLYILW